MSNEAITKYLVDSHELLNEWRRVSDAEYVEAVTEGGMAFVQQSMVDQPEVFEAVLQDDGWVAGMVNATNVAVKLIDQLEHIHVGNMCLIDAADLRSYLLSLIVGVMEAHGMHAAIQDVV